MARIVAVTGATGTQGGSVVRALLKSGEWKVRAITRNPNGEAAQALVSNGVEVVSANYNDEGSLTKAFAGAYAIYAVTNFWEGLYTGGTLEHCIATEERQGMLIAKAASQTASLRHFIWSTLPPASELSGGRIPVPHWEGKAAVDRRIRSELPELAVKTTYLIVSFYSSNVALHAMLKPFEVPGTGKYVLAQPTKPSALLPVTGDVNATVGVWVRQILANPQKALGKYASVTTEVLSWDKMVHDWSEVTGKPAVFVEISAEAYEKLWGIFGADVAAQLKWSEEIPDWHVHLEGRFLTKEDLGIKPHEAQGFKSALEVVKDQLL